MKNIIDKYAARPEKLKCLCLAYFSIWYCSTSKASKPADTDDEEEKEEVGNYREGHTAQQQHRANEES